MISITVKHSSENSFWGWSSADLETVDQEASISKLNQSIKAEVERLFPGAAVTVESGDYQDTTVVIDGEEELAKDYVLDAVSRAYGAMDWVVYK